MPAWGFYITIRGSTVRGFGTTADPRGARRYLCAAVVLEHAERRHPELSGTRCTEECLGIDPGSVRGSAPLADLAIAWRGIGHDVARAQNIPYH